MSDEENTRGLFFDSIIRRAQKAFPNAKYVFAHPFVRNPEAQLEKNGFDLAHSTSISYDQKNVGRSLSDGEESVLNTAIKILLWKIYGRSFKNICWYRYAYIARIPERRALDKKYKLAGSESVRRAILARAKRMTARFVRGYAEIPDKELRNFPLYPQGTKAKDIDYDRIVFDTYDYLDKLISFKLSDIFYAIFEQCHKKTQDRRALRLAQFFKYGTDDKKEIWMLRYGLTFEEIETIKPYIETIDQSELKLSPAAYSNLSADQLRPIERYI